MKARCLKIIEALFKAIYTWAYDIKILLLSYQQKSVSKFHPEIC